MAGGQGFKGNKGTGEGVYIQVVMDAEDAVVTAQQLDGEVDRLAVSFGELATETKVAHSEFSTLGPALKDTEDKTKDLEMATILYMAKLTMVVSGLNQLTGSLYKTIGGLEAAGAIQEDTARHWQENARIIETLTGPLELIISLEILYSVTMKESLIAKAMNTKAYLALAAATSAAAAAAAAFAIANPFTAILLVAFALSAVIVLLSNRFGVLGNQFEWLTRKAEPLVQSISDLKDGVRDLLTIDTSVSSLWGGLMSGD